MLDLFIQAAYEGEQKTAQSNELAQQMLAVGMSKDDLFKVATGQVKLADVDCVKASSDGDDWLTQFRGTPLLPQALALLEEDIKTQTQEIQNRLARPPEPETWVLRDQLRLRKKLLELELVKTQEGAAASSEGPPGTLPGAVPPAPSMAAAGGGALGPDTGGADAVPKIANAAMGYGAQSVQRSANVLGAAQAPPLAQPGGLTPPVQKMAEAMKTALSNATVSSFAQKTMQRGVSPGHLDRLKTLGSSLVNKGSQMAAGGTAAGGSTAGKLVGQGANLLSKLGGVELAIDLGKELARSDSEKIAANEKLTKQAAGMLDAVKGVIKAHPVEAATMGGGALVGALSKDRNGERHPIKGALGGAATAGTAVGIAKGIQHGKPIFDAARAGGASIGDAAKSVGQAGMNAVKPMVEKMRGAVGV
jgi:hypothetical protein